MPWRWLGVASAPLGFLAGGVLRVRRAHVEASLARAGVRGAARVARGMYRSLARSLFEFLWMAGRSGPIDHVRLSEDAERKLAALARGRPCAPPCVVATAHTGNWDLLACVAASRWLPGLAVVTKRLRVRGLDRVWQEARRARGLELVHGSDVCHRLTRSLARGQSVALVIDQAPPEGTRSLRLPFAGALARYDRLPAVIALRAKAPLLLAVDRRLPDGSHLVEIPVVLEPPAHSGVAWIDPALRCLAAALDEFVRRYPEQWLWMHRRWKGAGTALEGSAP